MSDEEMNRLADLIVQKIFDAEEKRNKNLWKRMKKLLLLKKLSDLLKYVLKNLKKACVMLLCLKITKQQQKFKSVLINLKTYNYE